MSIIPTKEFKLLKSSWLLIVSNLFFLVLALIFSWSILNIVLAYLSEIVFIGLLNIPKIFLAKKQHAGHRPDTFGSKFLILFLFLFQYGVFVSLHFFLTLILFGSMEQDLSPIEIVKNQFDVFYIIGLLGIFTSHCYSFYVNFIKKKEFENYSPYQIMLKPFIRVLVIHGFIFLGGYVVLFFNDYQIILVVFFIMIKTCLDLGAHQHEHLNNPN